MSIILESDQFNENTLKRIQIIEECLQVLSEKQKSFEIYQESEDEPWFTTFLNLKKSLIMKKSKYESLLSDRNSYKDIKYANKIFNFKLETCFEDRDNLESFFDQKFLRSVVITSQDVKGKFKNNLLLKEIFNLEFQTHNKLITCLNISNDQKFIITGGIDGMVKLWDYESLDLLNTFKKHRAKITAVCINYSNKLVTSASAYYIIYTTSLRGQIIHKIKTGQQFFMSPNNKLFFISGNLNLSVLDINDGSIQEVFLDNKNISSMKISLSGSKLLYSCPAVIFGIFDLNNEFIVKEVAGDTKGRISFIFSKDESFCLIITYDRFIFYFLITGEIIFWTDVCPKNVYDCDISNDNSHFLTVESNLFTIWNITTRTKIYSSSVRDSVIHNIKFGRNYSEIIFAESYSPYKYLTDSEDMICSRAFLNHHKYYEIVPNYEIIAESSFNGYSFWDSKCKEKLFEIKRINDLRKITRTECGRFIRIFCGKFVVTFINLDNLDH